MVAQGELKGNLIINRGFNDINPLLCGQQHCLPGQSFGPAVREHYLLHYVFSGNGTYRIEEKAYPVCAGQLFIIKPYVQAFYQADAKNPWHYAWIAFETTLDVDYLFQRPVIESTRVRNIFESICECDSLHISKEFAITGKIFELFSVLGEQQIMPGEGMPPYILKAISYIEANYVMPISISRLAEDLNLDRSYFSAAFKRATNKSPQEYIVDFRLEKAAELMDERGYRPGEAGQSVGYRDIFNFSRMFKRRYGVSPTEYIERCNSDKGE